MLDQGLIGITCRSHVDAWREGLPPGPGIMWAAPIVVVMDPLDARPDWSLFLDSEELFRLSGIQSPVVRQAKLAAHVLLRVLLSRIDGAHPSSHALTRDRLGRPNPRDVSGWTCSLSHDPCGVAVAIGMSSERSTHLGVDLCRPLNRYDGLSFVLHKSEKQYLDCEQEINGVTMARFWSSKEALLKRWGWGLIPRMDRISTVPGQHYLCQIQAPLHAGPATSSTITSKVLASGVAVALAHHPHQVAEWWRINAAELDRAILES